MIVFRKIFKKKQSLGEWGEEYAAEIYKKKGYKILDKNYFNRKGKRLGEVDFIALKDKQLAFVEVKTRTSDRFGTPAEAVGSLKQQRLRRATKYFLLQNPEYSKYGYRIDVAELKTDLDRNAESVNIIENAVADNI
ncbi:MAG: YraN family protein [Candidatus Doudnabacteria bacterium CG10_big_fil_rev_8_21_14_0_10_41_10]|uniref:UPF0102 protein COT91_04495 n=1 Tax=Candidatus Doudnabacteria bacterium CG10_big_fil_rev_8_21_14_0_10_41_10 TaxID=1974551 RepID=A0A2H0VCM7_9BACT|nr:MAG: YraN family protein [Candidatus Doudnabacteria bacterium CG10_big_fil_rev_8_21_14_0_10_41_10]